MIYLYPYESVIQYKIKEEIKEIKLSTKSLENGRVKNIPIFEEELKRVFKQKKWISLFQPKQITLIIPLDYNEKDKEVFIVILENIGFRNIKCKRERVDLKKNKVILEVHQNYLNKIYLKKEKVMTEHYPYYIFKSVEKTLQYILKNQEKKNRFYFVGSNPKIPELIKKINQKNLFYYQDFKDHIIKLSSP